MFQESVSKYCSLNYAHLCPKNFQMIKLLGTGAQGEVYLAKKKQLTECLAIKILKLPQPNCRNQKLIKRIQNQIKTNFEISKEKSEFSEYFPQFYDYCMQDQSAYLFFQVCSSNTLDIHIKLKTYQQKYSFCLILLHDVLKALEYLQKNHILHRDIKPENILFKDGIFKLADLGLSRYINGHNNLTVDIGNIFSKSPEFYKGQYNQKCDVWSLGMTVFYLLENRLPFDKQTCQLLTLQDRFNQFIQRIKTNNFQIRILDEDSPLKKFSSIIPIHEILYQMLNPIDKERSLASQINKKYFSSSTYEDQDIKAKLESFLRGQEPPQNGKINQLLKFFFLKYLKHRKNQLGLSFLITLCALKQILKLNSKEQKILEMISKQQYLGINKKNFELQLLKYIKQAYESILQYLLIYLQQNYYQKNSIPITSFGRIEHVYEKNWETQMADSDDKDQLVDMLLIIVNTNSKKEETEDYEILNMKTSKSIKKIKFRIQDNQTLLDIPQYSITNINKENKTERVSKNTSAKSKSKKLKSYKTLTRNQKSIKKNFPKSLKYINESQQKCLTNPASILQNFMNLYKKDKLRQKFPLLGHLTQILQNLIHNNSDKNTKKNQNQFYLWDLPCQLFRI